MAVRVIKKSLAGSEDLLLGFGTEVQVRNDKNIEITKINASNIPYDETKSISEVITKKVDTLAALRSMTETFDTIWVSGYHIKGDGAFGSNIFEWDEDSTETDNGGTIIKCTTVTKGRYKLKYSGTVNVKWFGAVGDGIANDTVSIQSAINFAYNSILDFSSADEYLVSELMITNSITIRLNGCKVKKEPAYRGNVFYIKSTTSTGVVSIENGTLDGNLSAFDARMLLRMEALNIDLVVKDVIFKDIIGGVSGSPTAYLNSDGIFLVTANTVNITNCTFDNISRNGITLAHDIATTYIANCTFTSCYLFGIDIEPDVHSYHFDLIDINNNIFTDCGAHGASDNVWGQIISGAIYCISQNPTLLADTLIIRNNKIDMSGSSTITGEPVLGISIQHVENLYINNNDIQNCAGLDINGNGNLDIALISVTGNTILDCSSIYAFRFFRGIFDSNIIERITNCIQLVSNLGDIKFTNNSLENCSNNQSAIDGILYVSAVLSVSVLNNIFTELRQHEERASNLIVTKTGTKNITNNTMVGEFNNILKIDDTSTGSLLFANNNVTKCKALIDNTTSTTLSNLTIDNNKVTAEAKFIRIIHNSSNISVTRNTVVSPEFLNVGAFNNCVVANNIHTGAKGFLTNAVCANIICRDNTLFGISGTNVPFSIFGTGTASGNYTLGNTTANNAISVAIDDGNNIIKTSV